MKKFWSLDWFKSEREIELEKLKIKTQELRNEILEQDLEKKTSVKAEGIQNKPFKNVKLVNNVLTVVLLDGSIISKPKATSEDFEKVRFASTEEAIYAIIFSKEIVAERDKEKEEYNKIMKTVESFDILKNYKDFEVEGRTVKLKGTGRTLPALLVEKFAEIISNLKEDVQDEGEDIEGLLQENEEYVALKRFFLWCCLNPRAEVADQLYDFLVRNSFRITKQGFFVALRNVVTVQDTGDKELVKFISESYNKIKAVWKKVPSKYSIYKGEEGYFFSDKPQTTIIIGNLQDLYLDLPNMKENRFTDNYTGTFDIRIGKVVSMPMEDCQWNTANCGASGLHWTSDEIHYVGCGDTSVLVLVNPMTVVGVGTEKGRSYEYLPIMTVPREEATQILHDVDFDTLELDDEYAIQQLESLTERAKEGFATEAKKYEFNIPQISSKEIAVIVSSLEDMKETISKRVNVIN